jgi:hypothetical protein
MAMPDFSIVIALVSLFVGFAGIYYQRRQTLMAEQQSVIRNRNYSWITSPAVLAMAALGIVAWVPAIMWLLQGPNPRVLSWGGVLNVSPIALQITVDGSSLKWYVERYRLIAVAFHYFGEQDIDDVDGIQKSQPYDIRREPQVVMVRPDSKFIAEILRGSVTTNYHLLLVPRGVNDKAFATLRQAKQLGVFDIWSASGPP